MMMHLGAQVAVAVVDNADEQHDEVSRAVRDERLGHETMNHDAARRTVVRASEMPRARDDEKKPDEGTEASERARRASA